MAASLTQDRIPGLDDIELLRQPQAVDGESIQQRFESFHALNPWVFRQLERMTADCAEKGFGHIGIGMLFELLRYRYGAATRGDAFRLNNSYRSRYARVLIEEHPEWTHLFEVRALRAA